MTKKDYVECPNPNIKYYTTNGINDQINYPYVPDGNGYQPVDPNSANFCFHRLPCGICKLTNQPCPKLCSSSPDIVWTNELNNGIKDPLPDLENHSTCKE